MLSLHDLCSEIQITILKFVLQPSDLPKTSTAEDFPFSKSIIPYIVPYNPLNVASEGIIQTDHHFRALGLEILFQETAYAPICLYARWFYQLRFLDLYTHVGYRPCYFKRRILLSEPTPFLRISYWTRLVLALRLSRYEINGNLEILSRL